MNSDSCINEVVNDIVIIASPTADFSFNEGCFGQPIQFTDISLRLTVVKLLVGTGTLVILLRGL